MPRRPLTSTLGHIGKIVPDQQIDPHLIAWSEIEDNSWKSLLLGNGFSINESPRGDSSTSGIGLAIKVSMR